jgi:hypothetical protein
MMDELRTKRALDDDLRGKVHAALKEFKERFVTEHMKAAEARA